MENYEIIKQIGKGNYGDIYLVKHIRENCNYVSKRLCLSNITEEETLKIENEINLLKSLSHPNIVDFKEFIKESDIYIHIIMDYCEGGDLYQKIKSDGSLDEHQAISIFSQLLLALNYLHSKKILHRDIKTQNIFIKSDRILLGDFGVSKFLENDGDLANTYIGTPYYMSPEIFKYKPYSYKSDVWALGCCLYEMVTGEHPFDGKTINGLAIKILKGYIIREI